MDFSSEQSYHASGAGLSRRPVSSSMPPPPAGGDALRPDVEPPPKPRPVTQVLAFGAIVFLACLQLLPATHFRHPADPRRNWMPLNPNKTMTPFMNSRSLEKEQSNTNSKQDVEIQRIHIFSWMECLDLRVLAVFANSTLSRSRYPENIHFHFFVPEGEDEKLSYYKLKVLLPHSNLDITGQKVAKERLQTATSARELLFPFLHKIAPLVISSINSLSRFIYVSPNAIMKGNIEELFDIGLGRYSISAAEDCSKRLGDYVNIDVLNAIQRTDAKSWVSKKPYDKNACLPDLSVLSLDASKLEKNLLEAILWWRKVLDLENERSNWIDSAIALAFYDKYLKLPSTWKLSTPMLPTKDNDEAKILPYDGPTRACSQSDGEYQIAGYGNLWQQYLSSKSNAMLSH